MALAFLARLRALFNHFCGHSRRAQAFARSRGGERTEKRMNPVTFTDLQKSFQDLVDAEGAFDKSVSDDDQAHAALMTASAAANQTASAKTAAQSVRDSKLAALESLLTQFGQQQAPAPTA
jgi:hypothetical protein